MTVINIRHPPRRSQGVISEVCQKVIYIHEADVNWPQIKEKALAEL